MNEALDPWNEFQWTVRDIEWSLEQYERLKNIDENDPEIHFFIGLAAFLCGHHEESEERFEQFKSGAIKKCGNVQNAKEYFAIQYHCLRDEYGLEGVREVRSIKCMINLLDVDFNKPNCLIS